MKLFRKVNIEYESKVDLLIKEAEEISSINNQIKGINRELVKIDLLRKSNGTLIRFQTGKAFYFSEGIELYKNYDEDLQIKILDILEKEYKIKKQELIIALNERGK